VQRIDVHLEDDFGGDADETVKTPPFPGPLVGPALGATEQSCRVPAGERLEYVVAQPACPPLG
jgi:hypothetical protein